MEGNCVKKRRRGCAVTVRIEVKFRDDGMRELKLYVGSLTDRFL